MNSSGNLQDILKKGQFQKKKSIFDDSKAEAREKSPEFDCSGGLSDDSDDSDGGPCTSTKILAHMKKQTPALINSINQASGSKMVDLKSIHDNLQQMENDKAKLINYNSRKEKEKAALGSQKENVNIADLLAMGEGAEPSTSNKKPSQKRARPTQGDDSDSDGWEEVEGKRTQRPKYFKLLKKFEFDG